jgi:hypothetical protein
MCDRNTVQSVVIFFITISYILSANFDKIIADIPRQSDSQPLKVVDLGAGCGLTSLALHRKGFNVIATDKNLLLPLLTKNVSEYLKVLPDCLTQLDIVEFEWGKLLSAADSPSLIGPDFIVCSDCLYSSASIEPLIETLEFVSIIVPECDIPHTHSHFCVLQLIGSRAQVLLVNEMRTALEEFLYLSRRRTMFSVGIKVSNSQF